MAGTPQSATLGSAFATNLQVAFTNSNGCPVTTPVAGIGVTFSAPAAGSSGLFAATGANTATVGSDASGSVSAPPFTANYAAGAYTVIATSPYGSVSFALTNVEGANQSACGANATTTSGLDPAKPAGKATKLTVGVGATQSAPAGARFAIRLAVTVTDAGNAPVPGTLVTFAAPSRGPSGSFAIRSGRAPLPHSRAPAADKPGSRPHSRVMHSRRVQVRTNSCGVALTSAFTANHRAGGYVVVASVEHVKAAFALVNEAR
jgi:hypothetical protein